MSYSNVSGTKWLFLLGTFSSPLFYCEPMEFCNAVNVALPVNLCKQYLSLKVVKYCGKGALPVSTYCMG